MKINLIVNGGVYNSQSAYTAYRFAEQAIQLGHSISQVFFYRDGVNQANALCTPLADEFNPVDAWTELAKQYPLKLVVCVSAAERRGVMNEEQRQEVGKTASNLHQAFTVEGLGVMHDATLSADRTVTFK